MADVSFTAWVNSAVRGDSGNVFVLKTAEDHRTKQPDDSYKTTGRTFREVKVSRNSGINLGDFSEGRRIRVKGREQTESRTDLATGQTFYYLTVWADSITDVTPSYQPASEPAKRAAEWDAEPF